MKTFNLTSYNFTQLNIIQKCFTGSYQPKALAHRLKLSVFYRVKKAKVFFAAFYFRVFHFDIYLAQTMYRSGNGLKGLYQWVRLYEIEQIINRFHIRSAMEFGSGASSILFTKLLGYENFLTFEESSEWAQKTSTVAEKIGLKVQVRVAPKIQFKKNDKTFVAYDANYETFKPDLVYVDGPSNKIQKECLLLRDDPKSTASCDDIFQILKTHTPKVIVVDGRRSTLSELIEGLGSKYYHVLKSEYAFQLQEFNLNYLFHSVFIRADLVWHLGVRPSKAYFKYLLRRDLIDFAVGRVGIDFGSGDLSNAQYFKTDKYIGIDIDKARVDQFVQSKNMQMICGDICNYNAAEIADFGLCVQTIGFNRYFDSTKTIECIENVSSQIADKGTLLLNIGPKSISYFSAAEICLKNRFSDVQLVRYGHFMENMSPFFGQLILQLLKLIPIMNLYRWNSVYFICRNKK